MKPILCIIKTAAPIHTLTLSFACARVFQHFYLAFPSPSSELWGVFIHCSSQFYYADSTPVRVQRPISFASCVCLLLSVHTHFAQCCFSIFSYLPPEIHVFAGNKTILLDRVLHTLMLHDQRKSCLLF